MRDVVELTKDLIRFKTTHTRPEEIQRCMAFIQSWLQERGVRYQRLDHQGVPSVLVAPDSGRVPVLLMTHIDVVQGPDAMFEPREADGCLYGRGSIDDKYAAALSMVLLHHRLTVLRHQGLDPADLPVGILITGDEEIGGAHGAGFALNRVKADLCIALDGGSLKKMVIKEKGVLRLRLTSKGKAAHGSRPWLGDNAIEKLISDYQAIRPLFKPPENVGPDHWHRTLNFSILQAGRSPNQVPDHAVAVFDIRYTEDDDIADLLDQMRGRIQGQLTIEEQGPLFISPESPLRELLLDIAGETETGFEHGASDARFLIDHGIAGIVWGADGDMSQHSDDEHVHIDSIRKLYHILDTFLSRLDPAGGKV